MSAFAVALARTEHGWVGEELDLAPVEDLDALADDLRDLAGEGAGPSLLLLEENDEYVAVVRVDGGAGGLDEPRVFLSDRRAVRTSDVAGMLWPDDEDAQQDEDDGDGVRPVAEPVGDSTLLADLGTSGPELIELCAEEGLLPADVLSGVCERAGCLDRLEALREG